MAVSYNLHHHLHRGLQTPAQLAADDPGSGGTVEIPQATPAFLTIGSSGARTLESADFHPVGAEVVVIAQAACSVNDHDLTDGDFAIFIVTENAAGTKAWSLLTSTQVTQESTTSQDYEIAITDWRVHDALQTILPATPANDDLGIQTNTFGTTAPELNTGSPASGTITRRARTQVAVPLNYVTGNDIQFEVDVTEVTAADDSATLDVEIVRRAAPGTDIVTTAAQDIKAGGTDTYTFAVNGTNVVPGEILDIRVTATVADSNGSVGEYDLTRFSLQVN